MRPLIIDSFAGGGGASEGIRAAIGRDPDFALNHDRIALAMHRINHPGTHHIAEDVWNVDARSMCGERPIGLLWMSPDCTHHSKARGGKPKKKEIRGLAWVGVRWIKSLPKWQRPHVVCLENVEEFQDWGPLLDDGRPCPVHRGATFKSFVQAFEAMGYAVEWRELRACDYGAPTIRKRLFLVARRDGRPIVWPKPTHRPLSVNRDGIVTAWAEGHGLTQGDLQGLAPYRTAADIIDWSLPCPSIFETSAEIKARWGIRANRPLADATMARIAKGTMRYVVNAARPFLVRVNHGDSRSRRDRGLDEPAPTATHHGGDALVTPFVAQVNHGGSTAGRYHALGEPMPTMTGKRGEALVMPFVTYGQQGGGNRDACDPLHTVCASPKDQNAIVAPVLVTNTTGHAAAAADLPLSTITTGSHHILASGFLVPRYGERPGRFVCDACGEVFADPHATDVGGLAPAECPRCGEETRISFRPGQDPRARAIDEPMPVIVPNGNEGSLAAVHLTRQFGASVGSAAGEPVGTITAGGAGKAGVVAAFLAQHNTDRDGAIKPGADAREPIRTLTASGGQQSVVSAFMAQHTAGSHPGQPAKSLEEPVSTITGSGSQQGIVAAHMLNLRGSDRRDAPVDVPAPTVTGGGNHAAAVYAFLAKYYGEGLPSQAADEPLHTITAKPRHGVVTVTVEGQPYVIVDIGMRMLTPRERFNAQGFRPDYVIDRGELEDGTIIPLTLEQQGKACGNSVCPQVAQALVAANYREDQVRQRRPARRESLPLFAAE